MDHATKRHAVVISATLAALAATALSTLAIAPARGAALPPDAGVVCANAEQPPAELTTVELRRAVRCLINAERVVRERDKLERDRSLKVAAQRHAETMVATDCLAHRCGDELQLEDRIRRAGYLVGADAWQYAESTGCGESARAMVSNWMDTHFHRVNILEPTYRDIGVGAVQKPVATRCDEGYATFAVVFGWRTPPAD